MKTATRFACDFGRLFALALLVGCSAADGEQKPPDYDALRAELAHSLSAVDGWSAVDLERSEVELTNIRTSRVTELVWRSYRSEETGEEVWMTLVAGHRRDLPRYAPIWSGGCKVQRSPKSLFAVGTARKLAGEPRNQRRFVKYGDWIWSSLWSSAGNPYCFYSCEQISPDRRYLLWARTLDGKWTPSLAAVLGGDPQNKYGFSVTFEVISPPHFERGEVSADAKRLIADLMDRISPVVFASQPLPIEPPLED
jgi:hypothetical protein